MTNRQLFPTAIAVALAWPAATMAAASTDTFPNGQSVFGQLATSAPARNVEVTASGQLNVAYGDSVTFRGDGGQQFTWTFDGLDRRTVDLARIAPAGFPSRGFTVYVGRNPMNRP